MCKEQRNPKDFHRENKRSLPKDKRKRSIEFVTRSLLTAMPRRIEAIRQTAKPCKRVVHDKPETYAGRNRRI